jgi:prevent-host-death family protein
METVNIREARRRLRQIVDAAERGKSVVITRRGRKIARVVPAKPAGGRGLPDLTEFRKTVSAKGKPLSATVLASRSRERY